VPHASLLLLLGEDEHHELGRHVARHMRRRGEALHLVARHRGWVEERQLVLIRAIGRSCCHD
jgi:RNA:NAD 2'-phosphotransferase (TPT1/KptA family)